MEKAKKLWNDFKENKMIAVSLVTGLLIGMVIGSAFYVQKYNDVVERHDNNVDKYNELLEQAKELDDEYDTVLSDYENLKETTEEWTSASEADKQAFRNLTESQKAKLEEEQKKREEAKRQKELEEQRKATEGTKVYENNLARINFLEATSSGMVFLIENKTDKVLTFQADSVAVDGISTNDIIMSDDVAPQSKGKIVAKCSLDNLEPKTVSGQLRIIDFDTFNHQTATFTNINVE